MKGLSAPRSESVTATWLYRRSVKPRQLERLLGVNRSKTWKTVEEIRTAFRTRYPAVDDDQCIIADSGFIHEHPLTAIGIVLISSLVLGTTDSNRPAEFTRYSRPFVLAIQYGKQPGFGKTENTSTGAGRLVTSCRSNKQEDKEFWEHIQIADGSMWTADANSLVSEDVSSIFWGM